MALQALFEVDVSGHDPGRALAERMVEEPLTEPGATFCRGLLLGALRYRAGLDDVIQRVAPEWPIEQMAPVDRNILRLAIYEMLGREDIPVRVAIDQAIELAKRFGAAESGAFVNGILDRVLHEACLPGAGGQDGADADAAHAQAMETGGADPVADVPAAGPSRQAGATRFPDIKDWDEE